MELIRIENSSNIDAIGYLLDVQLLRVRFRDGAMYDYPATSAERYAALMSAPSKGTHLAQHFPASVRCLAEGGEIKLKEPYVVGSGTSPVFVNSPDNIRENCKGGQTETFVEDDCCSKLLMKAKRSGDSWVCPKCGCEWRARMIETIKHWEPKEAVMIW